MKKVIFGTLSIAVIGVAGIFGYCKYAAKKEFQEDFGEEPKMGF